MISVKDLFHGRKRNPGSQRPPLGRLGCDISWGRKRDRCFWVDPDSCPRLRLVSMAISDSSRKAKRSRFRASLLSQTSMASRRVTNTSVSQHTTATTIHLFFSLMFPLLAHSPLSTFPVTMRTRRLKVDHGV